MQTDTERIGDTDYVCQLKWNLPYTFRHPELELIMV